MKSTYHNLLCYSKITFCLILLVTFSGFIAFQNDKILIGKWQTEDNDIIEFYQTDNVLEGKIISLGNKEITSKNREIIGAVIFKNLKLNKDEFTSGSYLDIESKDSYRVTIKIVNAKLIKLKFGSGIFSQTSEFKKVK